MYFLGRGYFWKLVFVFEFVLKIIEIFDLLVGLLLLCVFFKLNKNRINIVILKVL